MCHCHHRSRHPGRRPAGPDRRRPYRPGSHRWRRDQRRLSDRELHLLGYFVSLDDGALADALQTLRDGRTWRYREMLARLRTEGVDLPADEAETTPATHALGRRHLAELLVRQHKAATVREAFSRYLHDGGRAVVPKLLLPVDEAIRRVREAGGVASWRTPRKTAPLRS